MLTAIGVNKKAYQPKTAEIKVKCYAMLHAKNLRAPTARRRARRHVPLGRCPELARKSLRLSAIRQVS